MPISHGESPPRPRQALTEPRRAKPRHLAPEFAVQFGDEEVAAAYRAVAPHVEWLAMAAEDYTFERRYSAVVAAEAFH
jgi:hypothetical protein